MDAYCRGLPRSACPYAVDTDARRDWTRGWDESETVDFEDSVICLDDYRKSPATARKPG
ncbi:Rmf/CrpP family protein [Mesorhizobium sp. IMUNJ 23232]|uniref:Rmf/CrpP family protein n=1 Tax=Mesorhizobium sp. IMUNJ 23232 TaxID=3376064 RepID=UPI0037B8442D